MSNLRIWWIPQVPMPAMHVDVTTVVEAKLLLNTLAAYDRFQYENQIKGDYCNAGGLEMYAPGEDEWMDWIEWYDPETGEDINSFSLAQLRTRQHENISSVV